jgi:AcrR family transcriptional regulator
MSANGSLRDRTRERMREEVAATALSLFLERGFDAVTTGQIAAAAGISPRSFFRYFETKEDVVLSRMRDAVDSVREALAARPAAEPVWTSLRFAFRQLVDQPGASDDEALRVTRLIMTSPAIQARNTQKRRDWEQALLPEITARLPHHEPVDGLDDADRARALLAAGLACVDAATQAWLAADGRPDPIELLDALMTQLGVE